MEAVLPQTKSSELDDYQRAWDALGVLLDSGKSWSGRERNCCFLNTKGPRFANIAGVAGLDQISDSRGIAVTDWDQDGDPDLWVSNRTAPRVRFLRNNLAHDSGFLALRLQGVRCNRDAIGARVELHLEEESHGSLIRTLHAGDGYLSQSSKWLHFGLGKNTRVRHLTVRWPGGEEESFTGIQANQRYVLIQESGRPMPWRQRPHAPAIADGPFKAPQKTSLARIIPHARLPLPPLDYQSPSGKLFQIDTQSVGATLLVPWATWCAPCIKELRMLQENATILQESQIQVVPLNIDDVEAPVSERIRKARTFSLRRGIKLEGGLVTSELLEILDTIQRSLVGRKRPLAIPCAFLLDQQGRLVAHYKGTMELSGLLADAKNALELDSSLVKQRAFAISLPGRWMVNPFPGDLANLPNNLLEASQPKAALAYAERVFGGQPGKKHQPTEAGEIGDLYHRTGVALLQRKNRPLAIKALQSSLNWNPKSFGTGAMLALAYQANDNIGQAIATYQIILRLRPGHPAASNSLAWLLATTAQENLRDPAKAIRLAQQACQATQHQTPELLATLAAARASAGNFEEAVKTASTALKLAKEQGKLEIASKIQSQLTFYNRREKPF